ncbi:MAG: DUF5677 domain-containing protein [Ilumatobacteraceae bacterium]
MALTKRCVPVMADDLLAETSACLAVLRRELHGARLQISEEVAHAPQAIALLSRMVYLCEGAVDLARTERKSAAAVLVRPAIECWIDCCYLLYCKWEAVLQLTSLGLRERVKLARIWLGDAPVPDLVDQLDQLDEVVAAGHESGVLDPEFKLVSSLSVESRLVAAIRGRGATPTYLDVYDYLYRMISLGEIHTSSALDSHAVGDEIEFHFQVTPVATLNVEQLIALTVRMACGAAVDVFPLIGSDDAELDVVSGSLDARLGSTLAVMQDDLAASADAITQRALAVLHSRGQS